MDDKERGHRLIIDLVWGMLPAKEVELLRENDPETYEWLEENHNLIHHSEVE